MARPETVPPGGAVARAAIPGPAADPRDDEAGWFDDRPGPGRVAFLASAVLGTALGCAWICGLSVAAVLSARVPSPFRPHP